MKLSSINKVILDKVLPAAKLDKKKDNSYWISGNYSLEQIKLFDIDSVSIFRFPPRVKLGPKR